MEDDRQWYFAFTATTTDSWFFLRFPCFDHWRCFWQTPEICADYKFSFYYIPGILVLRIAIRRNRRNKVMVEELTKNGTSMIAAYTLVCQTILWFCAKLYYFSFLDINKLVNLVSVISADECRNNCWKFSRLFDKFYICIGPTSVCLGLFMYSWPGTGLWPLDRLDHFFIM